MLKFFFTLLFAAMLVFEGMSQTDTLPAPQAANLISSPYFHAVKGAAAIYNGFEYVSNYQNVNGSPFFKAEDFTTGKIWYEGILYSNVPVKYDVVKNELVIRSFQNESMSLSPQKTDSFFVLEHLFVRLVSDSSTTGLPAEDFYDLLYNGNIKLFAKRLKAIAKPLHPEDPSTFSTYDSYYILKGNVYSKVDSRQRVLNILDDKKQDVKAFIKSHSIKFKKDLENDLLKTVEYYDRPIKT